MKRSTVILLATAGLLFAVAAAPSRQGPIRKVATYAFHGPARLPDPRVTPGDVLTTDPEVVCVAGYTKTVRNVPASLSFQVYYDYGIVPHKGECAGGCELDHLISLELGGSNSKKNLWPERYSPRPGAHEKDVLENYLHREVCAGRMKLTDAQRKIARDWYAAYLEMPGKR